MQADIYAIVHFAEHCPYLRKFRMPDLNVTQDDLTKIADHTASEPHTLQYLALPRAMFRGRENLTTPVRNAVREVFSKAYIEFCT